MYTYLIGWSHYDKWYYGSRTAKNCSPSDLWTTYFTSSIHVKNFRKQFGEPDIIEIRQLFKDEEACIVWEYKVLRRLGVVKSTKWLNKSHNRKPPRMSGDTNPMFGKHHKAETKLKMRESKLGKPQTEDHKKNAALSRTGLKRSPETGKKISAKLKGRISPLKGTTFTEQHKYNMKLAWIKRKEKKELHYG